MKCTSIDPGPGLRISMSKLRLYIAAYLQSILRDKILFFVRILGLGFILSTVMLVYLGIHYHGHFNKNTNNQPSHIQEDVKFPLTLSLFLHSDQP